MRYATLILTVLFGHVVSAEATEVLLKARDQATANWTQKLLKKFSATLEKKVPGLNAVIIEIPPAKVANVVRSARGNPAISAVEAGGDYRQLFQLTPTANFRRRANFSSSKKSGIKTSRKQNVSVSLCRSSSARGYIS